MNQQEWARVALARLSDRIAKQHDIDYSQAKTLKDKHVADHKMIRAIGQLPGRKTLTEHVVKKIMQAKTFKSVNPYFITMMTIKKENKK